MQPVASDDVASAVADYTRGSPVNGVVEIAGPERVRLCDLVRRFLAATHDPRQVMEHAHARYFGAELKDDTLVPGDNPRIGMLDFEAWFALPKPAR
ncbi:hypothetical protein RA8CHR_01242 [Variovorax sp. RA8]|nr:hypothetical protein RA8CHR_01242 [Variovorax sp. RA8]